MTAPNAAPPLRACSGCAHFLDDAAAFESEFPGLTALSSGGGDTRGDQGLCRLHDRMVCPVMFCGGWQPKPD